MKFIRLHIAWRIFAALLAILAVSAPSVCLTSSCCDMTDVQCACDDGCGDDHARDSKATCGSGTDDCHCLCSTAVYISTDHVSHGIYERVMLLEAADHSCIPDNPVSPLDRPPISSC